LGHNYPGSRWYERSFALLDDDQRAQLANEGGFLDRTLESLFRPN
jgi:outer membrane protein assembly factor BamD